MDRSMSTTQGVFWEVNKIVKILMLDRNEKKLILTPVVPDNFWNRSDFWSCVTRRF
jgi:hypothetical protein